METSDAGPVKHPIAATALRAIANWVNRYRASFGLSRQLGRCEPDEVAQIAYDLGVPVNELYELGREGPETANLLGRLLVALQVDPERFARAYPATMLDLQRLCTTCSERNRCAQELAKGTAANNLDHFCANAFTLDTLFKLKEKPL